MPLISGASKGQDASGGRARSTLLGLLVTLFGLIWIGQRLHIGLAAIMRGFMVSNPQWALYGAILAVLGVSQVIWTNNR